MTEISKSERLLNLVSFLLKSHRPVKPSDIRESVVGYKEENASAESIDRRFERDKAALRDLGVPLQFVADAAMGGPGYVIPRDSFFLPHLALSPSERAILAMAGRFSLAGAAGPVSDALQSALRKLQFDSSIPGEVRETAEEHFLFNPAKGAGDKQEQENLRALSLAVLGRRAVRFSYYGIGRDKTNRRDVEPYGVGYSGGHWYLVGNDRLRKGIRVFRADRIRGDVKRASPNSLKAEFEVPADFRVQDHVGVPPWLYGKTKPVEVAIRLDGEVAFMVKMHPAPEDQWEEQPDGSVILRRQAADLDALVQWVLEHGRHAEAVEPPEFRARVKAALAAMSSMHKSQGAAR